MNKALALGICATTSFMVAAVGGPTAIAVEAGPVEAVRPVAQAVERATGHTAQQTARQGRVEQVVTISVDGLNPQAIRRLGRSGTPAFHRMIRNGATTLNARTMRENTTTLPNHTGMVTGRHVKDVRGRDGHGVDFNYDDGGTVHRSAGEHVDSSFTVVHDFGGSTAFYSAKEKFAFLDRSWNATTGGKDTVGADNGRDKIDRYTYDDERTLVTKLVHRLRSAPDDLSFLHIAFPDLAGHAYGFMGHDYLDAVRRADRQLGRVLDAIADKRSLRRHTVVVLTADHGGRGAGHGDPTKVYDYTIPFMVWGAGVAEGRNLYALNDRRRNPGTSRTTYAGKQPVRNGEMANLATALLGLPAVPGSQLNRRQNLRVLR